MSNKPQIRFKGFENDWQLCQFDTLYEKVSRKNNLIYNQDDIISVANMYFKKDSYITDPSYLLTYNIFKVGDIAFEGNKSKDFLHGRFVENTIGNGIVSHVFDVFSPKMKDYDLNFWKYFINNERIMGQILARSTKSSTMMTNLIAKDFLKETIKMPTYNEQVKIGLLLDYVEHLISLYEYKYEKFIKIKKSLLDKMFPAGEEDMPIIRFSQFDKCWINGKLGDIVYVYDGVHHTPNYQKKGIMFLSVENIKTLYSNKFISQYDYEMDYRVVPEKGDVFMTRIGDVGTPNVVESQEKLAYYVSLALLKPIDISPYFICGLIQSSYFRKNLFARTLTTAIPQKINKDQIGEIEIVYPNDKNEINFIGNLWKTSNKLINSYEAILIKLKTIKASLLEKLFV